MRLRHKISAFVATVSLFVLPLVVMVAGVPAPAFAATTACSDNNVTWHYIAGTQTDYLDGNNIGVPTAYQAGSDYVNAYNQWVLRTQIWGSGAAINYLNNEYAGYLYHSSGVTAAWLEAKQPQAYNLFSGSNCPTAGSVNLGWWNVVFDYVPYAGPLLSEAANYLSTTDQQWQNSYADQEYEFEKVSANRNVPAGGAGPEYYHSYSQQFGLNGSSLSGEQVRTDGAVEYLTDYEDSSGNWFEAYDQSGFTQGGGSLEPAS